MHRRHAGLVALGLVAGLSSALLGIGGGLVLIPALVVLFNDPLRAATATSLAAVLPVTVVGALAHLFLNGGAVDGPVVALLLVGAALGSWLGNRLEHLLDAETLRKVFAVFLFLMALQLFNPFGVAAAWPLAPWALLFGGVLVGLVSGFFGLSGGAVLVPLLTLGFGLPIHEAILTSLVVLVPLVGLGAFLHRADAPRGEARYLVPAALLGAVAGAALSVRAPPAILQLLFATLLGVVAYRLYFEKARLLTAQPTA